MKNLKILIVSIFTFLSIQSFGQGWEMTYPAPVDTFVTNAITADKMPNGDIAIYNEGYSHILKITQNGTPTWSPIQSLGGLISFGLEEFSKDNLIAAPDGNFLLVDDNNEVWGTNTNPVELHVAKLNSNFDTIWTKKHTQLFPPNTDFIVNDVKQLSDNNILVLAYNRWGNEIILTKINYNNGNILWTQSLSVNGTNVYIHIGKEIIENPDGTLMLFHQKYAQNNGDFRLSKLSSTGNIIWTQTYTQSNHSSSYKERTLTRTLDGGYVFSLIATPPSSTTYSPIVIRTDNNGNEVWRTAINVSEVNDLLVTSNNDILLAGQSTSYDSAAIVKLDINGVIQYEQNYSNVQQSWGTCNFQKIISGGNNNYIAIGFSRDGNNETIYAIEFNDFGTAVTTQIEGSVFFDQNLNCILDNNEGSPSYQGMVQVIQNTDTNYVAIQPSGFYTVLVLPGTYEVNLIPIGNNWGVCPTASVTTTLNTTTTQNLGLQPLINCSDLTVNISTPVLIRCFQNTYYVNYSNIGTQNETNAFIEIEFDPFLIVNSASIPYTQNGNIYTFQIGNLNVFQSGQFTIDVTVDCNAQLGQPHCVDAMIFPNQICLPNGSNWSGATIIADAFCSPNDSVTFKLENIGTGNMTQARNYWVIEDQILPLQGTYQLNAGQDTTFTLPANGYTYQIQADQEITHPLGNNLPSAVTFGCSSDPNITINNLINQFSLDDYLNFVDVDCQVNVGSYDPNDKQGFPVGYGSEHYITKNDGIEYLIRFQNTGTYTAFNVRIEDTIDLSTLDLSTLQLQGSSHAYNLEIKDGNVLVFNFNNIMLPDSNTNEPESHGFIRFKIGQKANNPLGTVIENSAAIYFDFNAPIITNMTFHTVGENFIQVVSTQPIKEKLANVKVFPNPFTEQATFEIETDKRYQNMTLTIYNVMGQAVKTVQSNGDNQLILDRNDLTSGVYFYQLQAEGLVLDSGKLMVN